VSFLNKKYPIDKNLAHHFLVALGLFLWTFVFLYFSEPFFINEFSLYDKLTLLPLYGLVESLSYWCAIFYQKRNIKKDWLLKNEVIFTVILSISGAILNYLFYKYMVVSSPTDANSFIEFSQYMYVPSLVIILPLVLISRFLLGKFSDAIPLRNKITIQGKGKYDFIKLNVNELLFIKSSDNYIEVNYIENNALKKKLLRNKITEIEKIVPSLLKTHRSYLINPSHFKGLKTENKKLYVYLDFEIKIPVSRTLQSQVKETLLSTTQK